MRKSKKKTGQITVCEKEIFIYLRQNRTLAVLGTVQDATNTRGNVAAFSQTLSVNIHKKNVSRSVCKKERYERLIGILSDERQ